MGKVWKTLNSPEKVFVFLELLYETLSDWSPWEEGIGREREEEGLCYADGGKERRSKRLIIWMLSA